MAVTESDGSVVERYRYSPYGESGSEGDGGFPFRFTGQKLHAAIGLYHYKARFYDPEVGRFLQADPIGYEDQMNLYAYVGDDPVNQVDPTGMCTGSRLTNDDETCTSTGGFDTGIGGAAQGVQIDHAVGASFVQASGESNATSSETRAAGRAFRASYNGSDRQFGFGSRVEVRAAAAGVLVRLTSGDGNEWGTATYSLGRDYGYADPVTSGSPRNVDINVRLPYGATYLDSIHSHPGALQQGRFIGQYAETDRLLAGFNNYAVGINRQLCLITTSGYRRCSGI